MEGMADVTSELLFCEVPHDLTSKMAGNLVLLKLSGWLCKRKVEVTSYWPHI